MAHADKNFATRRAPAAALTPLKFYLILLAFTCGLWAGTHHKKQSDLAPNTVGEAVATADGTSVRFAGIPGFTYAIEASEDGTNWTRVTSLVAPANGLMRFLDTHSSTGSQFYRTVVP